MDESEPSCTIPSFGLGDHRLTARRSEGTRREDLLHVLLDLFGGGMPQALASELLELGRGALTNRGFDLRDRPRAHRQAPQPQTDQQQGTAGIGGHLPTETD